MVRYSHLLKADLIRALNGGMHPQFWAAWRLLVFVRQFRL